MDDLPTTAIFLITGLITAAGANPEHPTLAKARSYLVNEQYAVAIFMAERIIEHYPNTAYAKSAKKLIRLAREQQFKCGPRLN
ncbi:MAG: hypothetical protein PVH63_05430 [Balneolaceae bacterium]|jgi:hypothetical protein